MKLTIGDIKKRVDLDKQTLNLSRRGINDVDVALVCGYLEVNTDIKILILRYNKIGLLGARALAANTTLTALNIMSNIIGPEGAKALASSTTLTKLNIEYNSIGIEGAKAFTKNTTLRTLVIRYNSIGTEGAKALALNTTLTTLDVRFNNIRDEGAKAIAMNTTLTMLDIGYNNIGAVGLKAFALNKTLTTLNVKRNNISTKSATEFLSMLNNSFTLIEIFHSFKDPGVNSVVKKILARNRAIHTYPQRTKLILASCAENELYQPLDNVITPLSLKVLCALTIIKTTVQPFNQHQTIPDDVLALLSNLRLLWKNLTTTFEIDSLTHYGIDENLILSEKEGAKLNN